MTPPEASVPVILEKTAARRMVWVDVARVAACILIIANHMAFYSAELYRWIWAEFLAARTPFSAGGGLFCGERVVWPSGWREPFPLAAELVSSSSVPGVGTGCGRSDRLVPPARILRVLPAYV